MWTLHKLELLIPKIHFKTNFSQILLPKINIAYEVQCGLIKGENLKI